MRGLPRMIAAFFAIVAIGCAPSGKAPETEIETPAPGLRNGSFTAQLNGFEIHYQVHGQGPVLMVVTNSWGLSLEGVRALFSPLEEGLTLVYFDPRGMGESGPVVEESDMGMAAVRADFQALRKHLGLESVNAIGWSNGAMNLITLAAEDPATIDNAIFVHGVASYDEEDSAEMAAEYPELIQKYGQFMEEVQNPQLSDAEKTTMMRRLWIEEWFPVATGDPDNAAALFDRLFADAGFSWPHADYTNRENPTFDATDLLPLVTARCLVVAGSHDTMKVEKVRDLAEGLNDAQFVIFESSGHFAPAEESEAFKEAVFSFLGVG